MSGLNTTHWPNRLERPFWWFNAWSPGVPFATLDDEPSGNEELIAQLLAPPAATLSIALPTPLVVGGGRSPWQLSFGPRATQGLFQSTFVGYDFLAADESQATDTPSKNRASPWNDPPARHEVRQSLCHSDDFGDPLRIPPDCPYLRSNRQDPARRPDWTQRLEPHTSERKPCRRTP